MQHATMRVPTGSALGAQFYKAPGVIWKKKKRERIPIWIASRRARELGFIPKTQRLFGNMDEVRARAIALTAEEKSWLSGYLQPRHPKIGGRFCDRMDDMLDLYQDHPSSNFADLEFVTQKNYIYLLNVLRKNIGSDRVSALNKLDVDGWYRKFRKPSKPGGKERISYAHSLMSMLRTVAAFGTGLYPGADKLRSILASMRFENSPARTQFMTAEMVIAFRREAHRQGRASLALGTTLQFETALRQGDVIGRWRPDLKPHDDPTHRIGRWSVRDMIWRDGLTWERHVSPALILTKQTNKTSRRKSKTAISNLLMCEMVVEELRLAYPGCITEKRVRDPDTGQMITILIPHRELLPPDGPLIVNETSGQPYLEKQFRDDWRQIARAAGIPDDVKNMDSRASAVTEASDADAPDEHLRVFATHSKFDTTRRYNRQTLHKSETVHAARSNIRAQRRRGLIVEHARPAIEYEPAAE